MKSYIKLISIEKINNKAVYHYDISENIKKYFNTKENFYVEYSDSIVDVPEGVMVIPFICNILPIIWLTNSILIIDEIDEDFYNSINNFKQGYINMYPNLKFNGELKINRIVNNLQKQTNNGTLFSGGVDAFATLIAHIKEKPTLITVWGADIHIDDTEGWQNVYQHILDTAQLFNLPFSIIKCNLKDFLNPKTTCDLVRKSGDDYWHGFQHGIGLLGLSSPLAFKNGIGKLYIASTYTAKDKVTCASHPTIDSQLRFCQTEIYHDQYEYTRQEKIKHICQFVKEENTNIKLRVCWDSRGGSNCMKCEKCIRTILGLIAEGANPEKFGFPNINNQYRNISKIIRKKLILNKLIISFWQEIQKELIKNSRNIDIPTDLKWLLTTPIEEINKTNKKRFILICYSIRHFIGNLIKSLS